DVDVMQGITVGEAMVQPAPAIHKDATLLQLRDVFREFHTRAVCVKDDQGELYGIVTLGDLQRAFETAIENKETQTDNLRVGDICTRDVVTAHPEDVLWTAIRSMGNRDIGRIPV